MEQPFFDIHPKILELARQAEAEAAPRFAAIDETAEYNSLKVLAAYRSCRVSESHFAGTTGYGYNDLGREGLEKAFARMVGAEASLFRHNFVSGTHTITTALFGVLRPGDVMVSLTGLPYDTLQPVLGLGAPGIGSLKDFGVSYRQLELLPDGQVDLQGVAGAVQGAKVAYIQRSRGYSLRPSLTMAQLAELIARVRAANPAALVLVDNCYGEFVEPTEPTQAGADLIMGSLIKNPGGGIAHTGGYIAGRADLVELCAQRLTAPGVGAEVGCTLGELRSMYQGLFFAPTVVAAALKTAVFAASLFPLLGFAVTPKAQEPRGDIIQSVLLETPQRLVAFCQGIQAGAPVDAFATPEPWDMPGYDSQVIMAAGAFNMGASIELSADAPLREPYAVWLQGALNYPTGKWGVLQAADGIYRKNLAKL